ncbi:MAG: hypothetical protein IPK83_06190 [Planctomycetes bacterium]|nr:hypothetical protein [Planctomycetota bacterium]
MSRVQCNRKCLIGVALTVCVCPVAIGAPTVKSTAQNFNEPANVERVQSSRVIVNFRLKPGAEPLKRIELYYINNGVENWIKAPNTKAVESPVLFDAPSDGLFGLYLVFYSASGASPLPSSGTQPHRWVRVDRTARLLRF